MLQYHILLCLWGQHPKLISGDIYFSFDAIFRGMYENPLFFAKFQTSMISASKGMANFFLEGPCKLLPQKGLFEGMGTMGFIFLCLNISITVHAKSTLLVMAYVHASTNSNADEKVALYWFCFNLLPQLILVS